MLPATRRKPSARVRKIATFLRYCKYTLVALFILADVLLVAGLLWFRGDDLQTYWIDEGGLDRLLRFLLHPNPFLDFRLYGAAATVCALSAAGVCFVLRRRWLDERDRVQTALLAALGIPPGEGGLMQARADILALVPCTGAVLQGPLAGLPTGQRLWLCFTTDKLLVLPGQGQEAVSLDVSALQKLYLVERAAAAGSALAGYALALDAGGVSVFAVRRLQDLVRVVNVLVKQGITLGYHAHAFFPAG